MFLTLERDPKTRTTILKYVSQLDGAQTNAPPGTIDYDVCNTDFVNLKILGNTINIAQRKDNNDFPKCGSIDYSVIDLSGFKIKQISHSTKP